MRGLGDESTLYQEPPAKPCPPPHPRVASRAAAAAASPGPGCQRRYTGGGAGVPWPGPRLGGEDELKQMPCQRHPHTHPTAPVRPAWANPARGDPLNLRPTASGADGRMGDSGRNTRYGHNDPNDAPRGVLLTYQCPKGERGPSPSFPGLPVKQRLGFALLHRWAGVRSSEARAIDRETEAQTGLPETRRYPPMLSRPAPTRGRCIPPHLGVAAGKEGGDPEVRLPRRVGRWNPQPWDPWLGLPF